MNVSTIEAPMVAFKEWAAVCEALLSGEQSLILRKGGIAEGRKGFAFAHRDFLLFPTFFHAQSEGLLRPVEVGLLEPGADRSSVEIQGFCRVTSRAVLTRWEDVEALTGTHFWREEVLRERFGYGSERALHLALVRTFRFERPLVLPFEKRYGGCRSWVSMPLSEDLSGLPVLADDAHEEKIRQLLTCSPEVC